MNSAEIRITMAVNTPCQKSVEQCTTHLQNPHGTGNRIKSSFLIS